MENKSMLEIHNQIVQDLIKLHGQGVVRIDDNGYEYVLPIYESEYDVLYNNYVNI